MNLAELNGKPFTLWLTDEANESAVFSGVARWDGSKLFLDRSPKPPFEIRSEWEERIQPVTTDEVRRILLGLITFFGFTLGRYQTNLH